MQSVVCVSCLRTLFHEMLFVNPCSSFLIGPLLLSKMLIVAYFTLGQLLQSTHDLS